jgi:phosphoribosylpyrophosphate synthetase
LRGLGFEAVQFVVVKCNQPCQLKLRRAGVQSLLLENFRQQPAACDRRLDRGFQAGESLVRLPDNVAGHVILCRTLTDANQRLIELELAASTARELGAERVTLVAPYLCYMRQDMAFHPGEAISQQIIGKLLARQVDALVTIDPHLHRTPRLRDAVPLDRAVATTATSLMAEWLVGREAEALIVGPDEEALQWVNRIASAGCFEYCVARKRRLGDRNHKQLHPSIEELYTAVNATFERGGNIIIPTFALERAQELLFYLRQGIEQQRLPKAIQIFLDSPMAISATEIFERHPECYDEEVAQLFHEGGDPFDMPGLHFTRETAESIALNTVGGGAVILAGSGMCTGGRVRHHLKHNLGLRKSSVVFVGYAAGGTLARRIIDGASTVRIFGEEIAVRAKIHTISGFSAHADQRELLEWHQHTGGPSQTFLVHGEEKAMHHFAGLLDRTEVIMPDRGARCGL